MHDALLAQYAVLSERGLHFGRLYWQSIAFHLVMLLGSAAVFDDLDRRPLAFVLILAGLATVLMAFVAWRVWTTEKKYEALLGAIEEALRAKGVTSIQTSPLSDKRGARFVVTLTLAVFGVALVAVGLSALMMQN
jgi:hypothetical protein